MHIRVRVDQLILDSRELEMKLTQLALFLKSVWDKHAAAENASAAAPARTSTSLPFFVGCLSDPCHVQSEADHFTRTCRIWSLQVC